MAKDEQSTASELSTETVRVEIRDGVMWLTLHRPERKNALSIAMYATLSRALGHASADGAVRAVVITGAEGVFTSGNDVADFQQNPPTLEGEHPVKDFLEALVTFDKPLVAGVDGAAVGIGTTLLLHCDLVYVTDRAKLRMPFVNLALVPEAGSSLLLPLLCGHAKASELLLLGDFFDAAKAVEVGIANAVVAPEALQARLDDVTTRLADLPLGSLVATKRLLKAPLRDRLEAAMTAEAEVFFDRLQSPEAMEAFMAFFQKRKPDFRQFS